MRRVYITGITLLVLAVGSGRVSADVEALAEVNAVRAQRGLKPFIYDQDLYRAAAGCADFRANG